MRPDKGVHRRQGSGGLAAHLFIPKDVRAFYGGTSVPPAKSLGTTNLEEANRKARISVAK